MSVRFIIERIAIASAPFVVGDHPGPLDDRVGAEDAGLRLADHRRAVERAVAAGVRDRERAAGTSSGVSCLSRARLRDVGDPLRHAEQVERLGVLHDRDDQPLPSASSTAKPRLTKLLRDDLVAAELAVHPRVVAQRLDGRAGDEREVGRVDAVGATRTPSSASRGSRRPSTCRPRSREVTCAEVSSERRMCSAIPRRIALIGSSDSPGLRGSDLAGAGARRAAQARRSRRCRERVARGAAGCGLRRGFRARRLLEAGAGLDEGQDVLLRHAAAGPGARYLGRVDPVLGRDARDDGRDERLPVLRRARPAAPARRRLGSVGLRLTFGRCSARRGRGLRGGSGRRRRGCAAPRRRCAPAPCRPPPSRPPPRGSRDTTPDAGDGTSVSTLSVEISSSVSSASICRRPAWSTS